MYIQELIIEGFKSYISRTHITGWDPEFNAITGLNGSGKSNVLDAICFVLGISNLSQVRASNLQDLIYKRGQAGVTKASVTIVFNNEDRARSPVGFESYRQITVTRQVLMGGRTKYIVNGHNAQQQTVQNLFQSVQLNINNPHFLIMQGRITKVLNMKSTEILSMVEEAAGTKMFEDRKNKAFVTMAKKERKVDEIRKILREEITPRLDQLRQEKRVYLDFQKTESDIERLNRTLVAFEYTRHQEKLNKAGEQNNERQSRLNELVDKVKRLQNEMETLEHDKQAAQERIQKDSPNQSRLRELEEATKEYSTRLVRLKTKKDLQEASTLDEQKSLSKLATSKGELERALHEKKASYEKTSEQYESFKASTDKKTEELQKTSELLQTLTTGITAEEGRENGYMEQLQAAKNAAMEASTTEEQAKLKIAHLKQELNEKEPQAVMAEKENHGLLGQVDEKRKVISQLEQHLKGIHWNPDREDDLISQRNKEREIITELNERMESLGRKLSNLDFVYTNPSSDFDRSKVKGLVAQLIRLDKKHFEASTALEICAGGKLFNVVVENEVVGAQLLDKGRLRRRWTLIPLNKIQGSRAPQAKIDAAERLAPRKVDLALSLVGYDHEVEPAMKWIFGNTFVCRDAETAKRVTFANDIRLKSVTFDGDVYDPHGTLSGGSKPHSAGLLVKIQEMAELREEIDIHERRLRELDHELEQAQQTIIEYKNTKQRLDLQTHQLSLLEKRIEQSTHAQLKQRVQAIKDQLVDLEQTVTDAQEKHSRAIKESSTIEAEMNEFKTNKDSKLTEMTERVNKLRTVLNKNAQKLNDMQRAVQTLELEIEQIQNDIASCESDMKRVSEAIEGYKGSERELSLEIGRTEEELNKAQEHLEQERQLISAVNEEMKELEQLHKQKSSEVTEHNLEIQKLEHEIDRQNREHQNSRDAIANLEREHEWIADQKQFFGQAGSSFDFASMNVTEARKTVQQLRSKHDSMRKKINVRVMSMIDNVEKKEGALKTMMETVQNDKKMIEDTIKSLDGYKLEALEKTWRKVNDDFAAIFGDLLPGNTCRLQAPEGKEISEGLEVKVNLGGVWKQSLTELSGGQRSLIALSLILSLLQFKPAPMYILDEVDAALDLSHTQNIGQLLRTRFKGSQFVVVSLKDGMFNNANVLFKTRFVDGTSVIERTTSHPTDKQPEATSRKRTRGDKENQPA
ncbi:condensin subunit [Lichtheimia corymbifera JMRC:FSU:9682]|uniref:Structural maintenance of chromosomes protein n=1 Tax=Lichtheimia corymbifera JMRC:FSU:9682 TaxID=1263082 RepID=A0A068SEK3_9FUNG|nr:condensin subunit [Lichtheimia corymbifera JMRC:FSU:9682]